MYLFHTHLERRSFELIDNITDCTHLIWYTIVQGKKNCQPNYVKIIYGYGIGCMVCKTNYLVTAFLLVN